MAKGETGFASGNQTVYDSSLGWRFPNPRMEKLFPLEAMGQTAENLVQDYGISREAQDHFAFESHQKAIAAQKGGRFKDELVPVSIPQEKGERVVVAYDEGPRVETTIEKLATLTPAFRTGGTVTAGNSSTLNDGAACVVLASARAVERYNLKPHLRWMGSAAAGVNPTRMGIGPVPAVKKLLERFSLRLEDIDLMELNEAFAAQSLAVLRQLGASSDLQARTNVNGGAIALGHPVGASGARILTTLFHEMLRRGAKRGLATLCVGVGQGDATLVEAVS
jgi:acetyl-CoA C-acetyltransferase